MKFLTILHILNKLDHLLDLILQWEDLLILTVKYNSLLIYVMFHQVELI